MSLPIAAYIAVGVLLAGYAVLDGFDLGVGISYPFLGRSAAERRVLRRSIGPVWDGNEVWLITAGGALFAAFPPVYATVLSGFYLAFILLLFGLILRAVSLEFKGHTEAGKDHAGGTGGARGSFGLWDAAFFAGSALPAFVFGLAAGNLVRGIPLDAAGDYAGSFLELLNPYAVLVGVTGLFLCAFHGAAWAALKTDGELRRRAAVYRSRLHWAFAGLVTATAVATAFAAPDRFRLTFERPLGLVFLALLTGALVWARVAMQREKPKQEHRDRQPFLASALAFLALIGLWASSSYPHLVPPPAEGTRGPASGDGLTVAGAASSDLSLAAVLVIAAIGMPVVIAYTAYVYRTFRGRVGTADAEDGTAY